MSEVASSSAVSDFDFLIGKWRIRHHTLVDRLADCTEWRVADAIDIVRPDFAGMGNVGHFVRMVDGQPFCGKPIRLFNPEGNIWRIWWVDTAGHRMEPPVEGRFEGAEGTFEGRDSFRGKPIRVRFHWSGISQQEAVWKQSFSPNEGQSWELNSIMEFSRDDTLPDNPHPNDVEGIFTS